MIMNTPLHNCVVFPGFLPLKDLYRYLIPHDTNITVFYFVNWNNNIFVMQFC
jgi:hypothetical protein